MARKLRETHKEKLHHKLMLTILSSIATALVAGLLGYKLNLHVPELYFDVTPKAVSSLKGFRVDTSVTNLGNGTATDIVIRYTFDKPIIDFDYSYPEGLNSKLPSACVSGGVSSVELLLTPARLLPKEQLEAQFYFAYPYVQSSVKVFSKETMGRPLSERTERASKRQRAFSFVQNLFHKSTEKKSSDTDQAEKTTAL